MGSTQTLMHASTVAVLDQAVVITGRSGSGKSTLALQLMTMGAKLVADDQTQVILEKGVLLASKPDTLPAKIEAWGIGLLDAELAGPFTIALAIDLNEVETNRHPGPMSTQILGEKITIWRKVEGPHFPAAIFHYLSTMSTKPHGRPTQ